MKIIGIDPGYDRLGIAVVEKLPKQKEILLYSSCLQTSYKDDFYKRLKIIGKEVVKVIEKYSPNILAIESLFITKNQKTAMKVSEVKGIIIYEGIKNNMEICEYTPLQIKMAVTGHGKSDKTQIIKMIPLLIKLEKRAWKDDEYDAIAVALTCLAYIKKEM